MRAVSRSEVITALESIFENVFDEEIAVSESLTADQVEDWDSLTHIRLMLAVESHFGIKFTTVEIGAQNSVGDLVTLIRAKTA